MWSSMTEIFNDGQLSHPFVLVYNSYTLQPNHGDKISNIKLKKIKKINCNFVTALKGFRLVSHHVIRSNISSAIK